MINLTINNKAIQVEEGTTIFDAAKHHNILIPHFCYMENVHQIGSCRICVVEVEGGKTLMASCVTEVKEGMKVHTNSERVRNVRKVIYELMLSDHPKECLSCWRNQNCELQDLGNLIQIDDFRYEGAKSKDIIDSSSPSIVRDSSKCILCRRCVTVCKRYSGRWSDESAPSRFFYLHRPIRRRTSGRIGLCQLRAVCIGLPGWSAERERFYCSGLGSIVR